MICGLGNSIVVFDINIYVYVALSVYIYTYILIFNNYTVIM